MELQIEYATFEDAAQIQKMMRRSVMATYPNAKAGVTPEDIEEAYRYEFSPAGIEALAQHIREPESGAYYFIAKEGGSIIGYCFVQETPEENLLARIHVDPDKKGLGIGTKLWERARSALNPKKDVVLWVVAYNENAIRIYHKWGFEETGEHKETPYKSGAVRREIQMVLKNP